MNHNRSNLNKNMRIFLLGIDGGSWEIINRGIKEEKLPAFKYLLDNGVSGNLRSTIPPFTCPAIPSLVTGKNPGKLGIYSFLKEGAFIRLVSSIDIEHEAIWDILSDKGIRCAVVGVPLTYPPKRLNGIMISGPPLPSSSKEKKDYTYPKELALEINYPLESVERISLDEIFKQKGKIHFYEKYKNITLKRLLFFKEIICDRDYDFLMFFIKGSDLIQHFLWEEKDLIIDYYRMIDNFLRELIELVDLYDLIFIVSDHGFDGVEKYFHINTWLVRQGYLKQSFIEKINSVFNDIITSNITLENFIYRIKSFIKKKENIKKSLNLIISIINRHHSTANKYENNTLFNNSKNIAFSKEPFGIRINPIIYKNNINKYNEIKETLIKKLANLQIDGNIIIKIVKSRENEYNGKHMLRLPDIVFLPQRGIVTRLIHSRKILVTPKHKIRTGQHNSAVNGIFIANGETIIKKKTINNSNIYDILPTILHVYKIDISTDIDGIVLKHIFKKNSEPAQRIIKYKKNKLLKIRLINKIKKLKLTKIILH